MSSKYSKAVTNLRKEKGLSQAALAEILGVSRQTVNYIEKDEKHLTPRIMATIQQKFGDLVNYIDVKSETQADRFRYARVEIIGKSQIDLASTLGIKQQTITDIESGRKQKIDTEILYPLYDKYGIKLEWLLFGIGYKTIEEEAIDIQDTYFNENVAPIFKYDFTLSDEENRKRNKDDIKNILYFDKRWLRNILGVNPDDIFFMYAPDDSMDSGMDTAKDIKKSDILFIDISKKQGNDNIFVYKDSLDNKPVIRQIKWGLSENIKLIPKNKKYKTETVKSEISDFMVGVVGKIIWNGSNCNL